MEYEVDTWGPPFPGRDLPQPGPEEMQALGHLIADGPRTQLVKELFELTGTPIPF